MAVPIAIDSGYDYYPEGAGFPSVTVTLLGGAPDAGDLLIGLIHSGNGSNFVNDPAWAHSEPYGSPTQHGGYFIYKVADGTEGDSFTFTGPSDYRDLGAMLWRVPNADAASIISLEDLPPSPSGGLIPLPGLTTLSAENLLLSLVWENVTYSFGVPSGWVKDPVVTGGRKFCTGTGPQPAAGLVAGNWTQLNESWSNTGGSIVVAVPPGGAPPAQTSLLSATNWLLTGA